MGTPASHNIMAVHDQLFVLASYFPCFVFIFYPEYFEKIHVCTHMFVNIYSTCRLLSDRELGGILEPPTTPIGRDEVALKRHRFFSDLISAAQAAAEHRVSFDPLGPFVADTKPIAEDAEEEGYHFSYIAKVYLHVKLLCMMSASFIL